MKTIIIIGLLFILGCSKENEFDQTDVKILLHVEKVNFFSNSGSSDVTASINSVKTGILSFPDNREIILSEYYLPGADIYLKVSPHSDKVKIQVGTNLKNDPKVNYPINIETTQAFEKHFIVISDPPYIKEK